MLGKFGDMMGKLQEMKQKAEEVKSNLDNRTVNVEGAGGDIKIQMNGNKKILNLQMADSIQHGNKEELVKQLTEAFNKAVQSAEKLMEEEMKRAAGGWLPGL